MTNTPLHIVWLRRDLRTYDHAAFAAAMSEKGTFLPLFIFDTDILKGFPERSDRRLSFIYDALSAIHQHAKKHGSGLLVCVGKPEEIWQKIDAIVKPSQVFAAKDFEEKTMQRDDAIARLLGKERFHLVKDHVIFAPEEIASQSSAPFKVYTPYSKAWWAKFTPAHMGEYHLKHWDKLAEITSIQQALQKAGVQVLDMDAAPQKNLDRVGYDYIDDGIWKADSGLKRLDYVEKNILSHYASQRDLVGIDGTSQLSPFLRFGIISIRDCFRRAHKAGGAVKWMQELIWREFYMMVMFYAPESTHTEWNEKYREKIEWSQSENHFEAWCDGQTGVPIVDAAMRQLVQTGWMHNRARMIVASFLTKDLHIDWRRGEAFFARYLMDYELASNVGGWQWAASTGTDAQPYFRIFNPYLQSKKFDPNGDYIRRYVPELKGLDHKDIHEPHLHKHTAHYPKPVVDHGKAREIALRMYKEIS